MIELNRFLYIRLITVKNASRVNIFQFLQCCNIILVMPFNAIKNVICMVKRVFEVIIQQKKDVKYFFKGPFHSHFLYVLSCYELSIEFQISIIFRCFLYRGFRQTCVPQCTNISVLNLLLKCSS